MLSPQSKDFLAEESWKSSILFLHKFLIKTVKYTFGRITLSIVQMRSLALSELHKKILTQLVPIGIITILVVSSWHPASVLNTANASSAIKVTPLQEKLLSGFAAFEILPLTD